MYYSPVAHTATTDEVTVRPVKDRTYHESLGILTVTINGVGTLYFDYDTAVKLQESLVTILDEYMAEDVATYKTANIDTSEVLV
jgi:hypothetical protein